MENAGWDAPGGVTFAAARWLGRDEMCCVVERAVGKNAISHGILACHPVFVSHHTGYGEAGIYRSRSSVQRNEGHRRAREGTRDMARRALLQWSGSPRATTTAGRQVNFDSDE